MHVKGSPLLFLRAHLAVRFVSFLRHPSFSPYYSSQTPPYPVSKRQAGPPQGTTAARHHEFVREDTPNPGRQSRRVRPPSSPQARASPFLLQPWVPLSIAVPPSSVLGLLILGSYSDSESPVLTCLAALIVTLLDVLGDLLASLDCSYEDDYEVETPRVRGLVHQPTRPVDKDKTEVELALHVKKAVSAEETAPKQKHVRSESASSPPPLSIHEHLFCRVPG